MARSRPLAIDMYVGLGGWAEGLIAAGFEVVGFDIEDMFAAFGMAKPEHFHLVLQDVLTLHGSQFKDADLIVASPPCQEFSYMAMPWSLAKEKQARILADPEAPDRAIRRLFPHSARSVRGRRQAYPARGGERARSAEVGRAGSLELRLVLPVGRRAGTDADDEKI
jgi:site-specific DNA-cytosine methylase